MFLEKTGLVRIAVPERKQRRMDGATVWFSLIKQLRPHAEDRSLPKGCCKVPASSLNLLIPMSCPALFLAVGTYIIAPSITTTLWLAQSLLPFIYGKRQVTLTQQLVCRMQAAQAYTSHSEKKE